MSLWEKLVGIFYVFLLYIVEEKDPIGFSWLLCWYLPHVVDIVFGVVPFEVFGVVLFCVCE